MLVIDSYYKKATKIIQEACKLLRDSDRVRGIENAITVFMSGINRGDPKCAYGILDVVMHHGSYTISDNEAASIYRASFPEIKLLAQNGDAEAMVMVAQGLRYGIVQDEEYPYAFWLSEAVRLGNEWATTVIKDIEDGGEPWVLAESTEAISDNMLKGMDATDMLLFDYGADLDDLDIPSNELQESVLLSETDWAFKEQELGLKKSGEDYVEREDSSTEISYNTVESIVLDSLEDALGVYEEDIVSIDEGTRFDESVSIEIHFDTPAFAQRCYPGAELSMIYRVVKDKAEIYVFVGSDCYDFEEANYFIDDYMETSEFSEIWRVPLRAERGRGLALKTDFNFKSEKELGGKLFNRLDLLVDEAFVKTLSSFVHYFDN